MVGLMRLGVSVRRWQLHSAEPRTCARSSRPGPAWWRAASELRARRL